MWLSDPPILQSVHTHVHTHTHTTDHQCLDMERCQHHVCWRSCQSKVLSLNLFCPCLTRSVPSYLLACECAVSLCDKMFACKLKWSDVGCGMGMHLCIDVWYWVLIEMLAEEQGSGIHLNISQTSDMTEQAYREGKHLRCIGVRRTSIAPIYTIICILETSTLH